MPCDSGSDRQAVDLFFRSEKLNIKMSSFEAFPVGSRVTVHLTWNKTKHRWNAAPGGVVETLWGPVHPVFGDLVIPWTRAMGGARNRDIVREGSVIAHLPGGRLRVKLDETHRRIQAWPLEV